MRRTLEQRFLSRIGARPKCGCWLWLGAKDRKGYGRLASLGMVDASTIYVHRLSFSLYCGEIPPGMMICHTCDVPACCNPDHLFIGTNGDNVRDSVRKRRHVNSKKTHCHNGHPYDEQNTHFRGVRRWRICATCQRRNGLASYYRRKTAIAAVTAG